MTCAFYTFANGNDSNKAEYITVENGIRHKLKIKPRSMKGNCMIGLLIANEDRKIFTSIMKQRSIRPAYYTQVELAEDPKWRFE